MKNVIRSETSHMTNKFNQPNLDLVNKLDMGPSLAKGSKEPEACPSDYTAIEGECTAKCKCL